jgi:hypothetical protein
VSRGELRGGRNALVAPNPWSRKKQINVRCREFQAVNRATFPIFVLSFEQPWNGNVTIRRAKRTNLGELPEWARIGGGWEIGVGEPVFLAPGEQAIEPLEDTLVRVLFGTFHLVLDDASHGMDAGWLLTVDGGARLNLRVRTRTQLRLFPRSQIESAHRLWSGYHRCFPLGSSPSPSDVCGAFTVHDSLSPLARWLLPYSAVLLRCGQGPLSQTLAALPSDTLPTLDLQRPSYWPLGSAAMVFHDGGELHQRVVDALASVGDVRQEELLIRCNDDVMRWMPCNDIASVPLLESLARTIPPVATAARDVARSQQMFEPVRRALAAAFPALDAPLPLALVRPLSDDVARAWDIGPIALSASSCVRPLGDGDYEVVPGAVGGQFRTCAIVVGSTSSPECLSVDVEFAEDHEISVHRCSLERRNGDIVLADERLIVQED